MLINFPFSGSCSLVGFWLLLHHSRCRCSVGWMRLRQVLLGWRALLKQMLSAGRLLQGSHNGRCAETGLLQRRLGSKPGSTSYTAQQQLEQLL